MRTTLALLTLSLAAASFAALPSAEARAEVCTIGMGGCPGFVCADTNADGRFSNAECVGKDDADIDPCHFQSDCCSTTGGLWCPEND